MTEDMTRRTLARAVVALRLLGDLVITAAVVAVVSPVWLLPWRGARMAGRWYGYAACAVWPPARRTAMINLRRAYGAGMTRARARTLTLTAFGHLGQSLAEGIRFSRAFRGGRAGWEESYEPDDPALERRILDDPRPKIFVTGHLGSWEIATAIAGFRVGLRGAAVMRRVDNPFLNAVVRWLRTPEPSQWIEKRGGTSEALRRLRGGHSIAMLLDENGGYRGVFVTFFDRPASTSRTPALLSLMTGAPVVLGAAVRPRAGGRLRFRLAMFDPAGLPTRGPEAVPILTQAIIAQYEAWVRDDPAQWRWIHWRWKTRPDGTEETYTRHDLREVFSSAAGRHAASTSRTTWRSFAGEP
jgi:KDO2-lipid IV(A) lauroyltransferase